MLRTTQPGDQADIISVMSDNASANKNLDPHEIAAQVAALSRHLQSSGVSFLPMADADSAERLQGEFSQPQASAPPDAPRSVPTATEAPTTVSPTASANKAKPAPAVIADPVQASYEGESLSQPDRLARLEVLSSSVAECTRCDHLAACRTNTVFGEGSATPRIVFFGEGPSADEDRLGRPFVGKAGQLLTKMIEACTLRREDVYILNTVKCRPPGNRNPDPNELKNCREYFEQQLSTLRPEYIVCLGAISSQSLLNTKLSVGRLRGKFHRYFDSKVLVTYHPAYLLRTPDAKKAAWQDLQLMLRDAGITLG
jgi:DNA polymerase